MKKFLLFPLVAIALLLASCTVNDDNPVGPVTPQEPAEYTVLFYGMGGASTSGASALDFSIVANNINDMFKAVNEYGTNANVVVNYKFSPKYDAPYFAKYNLAGKHVEEGQKSFEDYKGQTYRFAVEQGTNIIDTFCDENLYGNQDNDYANPDSLTNFINWAAEKYPAKKYILVLSDHGGGYLPNTDLQYNKKRNIMNEAMYGTDFSVHSLKYALQGANINLDVLYMDACLMNNVEYLYELKDEVDYFIASTFLVPGWGGDYVALLELLNQNNDIESVLQQYPDRLAKFWADNRCGNYFDVMVTRSSMLDAYATVLKEFTNTLCNTYQYGSEEDRFIIDMLTRAYTFKVEDSGSSYLLKNYVYNIVLNRPDAFPEDFIYRFQSAHDNCIVSAATSPYFTSHNFDIDHSIVLGANGEYTRLQWYPDYDKGILVPDVLMLYQPYGTYRLYNSFPDSEDILDITDYLAEYGDTGYKFSWKSTFADTYSTLEFSKKTGWDKWLLCNKVHPFSLSPANYELRIFEDDYPGGETEEETEEEAKGIKVKHNYRINPAKLNPSPEENAFLKKR